MYVSVGCSQQCLGVCTALSYSENSTAGLGMPARLKLPRYHLKSPGNRSVPWAWGCRWRTHTYVLLAAAVNAPAADGDPGDTSGPCAHRHLPKVPKPLPTALGAEVWTFRDASTKAGGTPKMDLRLSVPPTPLQSPPRGVIVTHQGAACPPYRTHSQGERGGRVMWEEPARPAGTWQDSANVTPGPSSHPVRGQGGARDWAPLGLPTGPG